MKSWWIHTLWIVSVMCVCGDAFAQQQEIASESTHVAQKARPGLDWNDAKITWHSLEDGLKASKKTGKSIMVVRYATWCGACKDLAPKFEDEHIVKASKDLIMVRVDVDSKEAEMAEKILESKSIPHISFLSSDKKVLPLTAEDSGSSKSPYFYGDNMELLAYNMQTAARKEKGLFAPITRVMGPDQMMGKEIFDTSMLFECKTSWQVDYFDDGTSAATCTFGGTVFEPRDTYIIVLDEDYRIQRIVVLLRFDPEKEQAARDAARSGVFEELKRQECKESEVTLPESLPAFAHKELKENLSHWTCKKKLEITLLHSDKSLMTIVASDQHWLKKFLSDLQTKLE